MLNKNGQDAGLTSSRGPESSQIYPLVINLSWASSVWISKTKMEDMNDSYFKKIHIFCKWNTLWILEQFKTNNKKQNHLEGDLEIVSLGLSSM